MIYDKYLASIEEMPEVVTLIAATPVTITLFFAINSIKDGIRLKKDFDTKNIQKVLMTPEVSQKHFDVDKNRISNFKNKLACLEAIIKITKNIQEDNLKNFYNNINELNIVIKPTYSINGTRAYYKPENNTIYLSRSAYEREDLETIIHELLHMASTICKNGMVYCGFSQKKKNSRKVIGASLTEGYTQLLTQRIYKYSSGYRYSTEVEIAKCLETIIGRERMENLYFNANLKGLIEELAKYNSEQEALKFIKRVDFITKYDTNNENKTRKEESLLIEAYKDIYTFLLKTYVTQQKELYDKDALYEVIDRIAKYIYSTKIDDYRGDDNILNKKNKDEIIKEAIGTPELDKKVKRRVKSMHLINFD